MKKYDIAAYVYLAYTAKDIRAKLFWPDGIGEWQTVKMEHKSRNIIMSGTANLFGGMQTKLIRLLLSPELVNTIGFDSLTHYQMVHYTDVCRDYTEIIPDMVKEWNKIINEYDMPYYPHVSIGWDNNPRFKKIKPKIVFNNTPENFKKALIEAKKFCDENCCLPLITVNSWNEWTETSYLLPDNVYGYGYLEAIKEVFGSQVI